jgi:hypothetical protein
MVKRMGTHNISLKCYDPYKMHARKQANNAAQLSIVELWVKSWQAVKSPFQQWNN